MLCGDRKNCVELDEQRTVLPKQLKHGQEKSFLQQKNYDKH